MKTVFLFLLLSTSAFACDPVPLASCDNAKSILLKTEQLKQLQLRFTEFQKLLDESILPSAGNNSCFNNHFAGLFLGGLKEPFTCRAQLDQVDGAIKHLLNQDSLEWKSLKSEESRPKLQALAAETKSVLLYFMKEHAD